MASSDRPSFFGNDNPFGTLFREVQKTFEDFSRRTPFGRFNSDMLSPKVDVMESKDTVEVIAELPGVNESDVEVTLVNGILTIRGEKKIERDEQDKDKNWHVVERSFGSFSRAIPLPFDPEPAKCRGQIRQRCVAHSPAEATGGSEQTAKDRNQERVAPASARVAIGRIPLVPSLQSRHPHSALPCEMLPGSVSPPTQ